MDSCFDLLFDVWLFEGVLLLIFCGWFDVVGELCVNVLKLCGVEIVLFVNVYGKVDLFVMLVVFGVCGVNELYVEVGYKLNGLLLCEWCVDELLVYLVLSLLGVDVVGMFDFVVLVSFDVWIWLLFYGIEWIGDDLWIFVCIVLFDVFY